MFMATVQSVFERPDSATSDVALLCARAVATWEKPSSSNPIYDDQILQAKIGLRLLNDGVNDAYLITHAVRDNGVCATNDNKEYGTSWTWAGKENFDCFCSTYCVRVLSIRLVVGGLI